jgi:hypothetical protein
MVNKNINSKNISNYLTQSELALRWRVSQSSIKKYRNDGLIPFFVPPNSSRILFPLDEIIIIEGKNLFNKEDDKRKYHDVSKEKMPVISAEPKEDWRI